MSSRRRLASSLALSLCAGAALFGLLLALIRVNAPITVRAIPHVQYLTVMLVTSEEVPKRQHICIDCDWAPIIDYFPAPRPPIPPIEIEPRSETTFYEQQVEPIEFDAMDWSTDGWPLS